MTGEATLRTTLADVPVRLNVVTRHVRLVGRVKVREVVQSVARATGTTPLLYDTRRAIADRLRPLGVFPPPQLDMGQTRGDILVSPDSDRAILLRIAAQSRPSIEHGVQTSLDVVLISSGDFGKMEQQVGEAVSEPLQPHLWSEFREIGRLRENLGELSPNGKLLQREEIRAAARRLYDDTLRENLKPIVNAVGDSPAPRAALEDIETFKKDPAALAAILADASVAAPHSMIYCPNCATPMLTFTERAKAESVIADCGRRCSNCREQGLLVLDTFAVAESYARALGQGIWLESLAADVVGFRSDPVWSGQMVGTYEVDVMCVFAGRTILVECKDTSFGQNDLSITAFKAQEVGAESVIVITTSAVHENVREAFQKLEKTTEDRRQFRLIASNSADVIRTELMKILDELRSHQVQRWLSSQAFGSGFERYAVGEGAIYGYVEDE